MDQKTKPSNQSLLPSEIDLTEQDTYWENIGGKPWDLEKINGVDLQYETLKKNDETGAIIVRVTINRGKISDQKVVRIHGFLSKSVYRKSVIDEFFAKALKLRADHGDQKASDILKLGQTDLQKIRINWPTLPDKWRFWSDGSQN
ncbi:lipoprotein 17-related variable surface protein [Mycoplasma sp. ATU-Cv-508]|uniref:lipoprotein 17-related variable surface protein n=1 Tax=Mycoplasma sp. ATU-Cv-508 TaxID=2048001 RepID=UPI0013752BEF